MKPWLQDPDVTLYHGDVLATLRELPAESVDCVVTSPPYWGLRDYGTGEWEGGDADCQHSVGGQVEDTKWAGAITTGQRRGVDASVCRKCGATRIDQQLGLEPTPEQYVERMVEVFREVRRVLAPHGTVWLNLGDSYAGSNASQGGDGSTGGLCRDGRPEATRLAGHARLQERLTSQRTQAKIAPGLKPKDLVGIPWRVAFALQADGWYLRSDIIWAKPNPMPESVTDRPTKAHEYVFLLSKQPRYFFDQEAVREAAEWARWGDQTVGPGSNPNGWIKPRSKESLTWEERKDAGEPLRQGLDGKRVVVQSVAERNQGRNIRSVWEIATQPYPEAHFATFPEELARRCIAAGCPEQVCRVCGKARERVVVATGAENNRVREDVGDWIREKGGNADGKRSLSGATYKPQRAATDEFTDCGHADYRPGIVLDPFIGSGTVAHVARKLGRHAIGIDLNAEYLALAARRLQQQSLFAEVASGS